MQAVKSLPLLILLCLSLGCSSYTMREVYTALEAGNPEAALAYMDEQGPKEPGLPFLFERGLVAHYANRFSESSKAFSLAEDISEDLYTRSVSKEALALITTDLLRPYPGTRFERLLSHYYRILNYIYLNKLDGALVECRRATNLIQYYINEHEEYDFFGAAFLAYLSGMIYETSGEWNNAFISYQQAEEYYRRASTKTGVSMPKDIGNSLVQLAQKLGFTEEAARYRNRYGDPLEYGVGYGELIIFYESGYVPNKYEETLMFPILKTDTTNRAFEEGNENGGNNRATSDFVETLLSRRGRTYSDAQLEYLLYVAMPAIRSNRPEFTGIAVQAGNIQQRGVLVADIQTMAIETLNSQQSTILLRSVTRAFLKYLIYRVAKAQLDKPVEEAEKKLEELEKSESATETEKEAARESIRNAKMWRRVGTGISNVVNVATEHADTRSWRTLPNQIFLVRMRLPEGVYNVNFSFLEVGGRNTVSQTLRDVGIYSNRKTFLNYRTYD